MSQVKGTAAALSWQQIVVGLLVLPEVLALTIALPVGPAADRLTAAYAAAGCLGLMVLLIAWHIRDRHRLDIAPDFLAQLVNPDNIVAAGDIHYALRSTQRGSVVELQLLAQNAVDGERTLDVRLRPAGDAGVFAEMPEPLALEIPPSSLVSARIHLPLRVVLQARQVSIPFKISGSGHGGRRVRFARRPIVFTGSAVLTVGHVLHGGAIGALAGAFGGGRTDSAASLVVDLRPTAAATGDEAYCRVESDLLWAPGEPQDLGAMRRALAEQEQVGRMV